MSNPFLQKHPAPWRYVATLGIVHVLDANNVEVQMFDVLDFACSVTQAFAKREAAQAKAKVQEQATVEP